jgi:hypothetical protein
MLHPTTNDNYQRFAQPPSKVHHTPLKTPHSAPRSPPKAFHHAGSHNARGSRKDVQSAATAIARAGDVHNASPMIGTVVEALADGGFERGRLGPVRSMTVVEYGGVGVRHVSVARCSS